MMVWIECCRIMSYKMLPPLLGYYFISTYLNIFKIVLCIKDKRTKLCDAAAFNPGMNELRGVRHCTVRANPLRLSCNSCEMTAISHTFSSRSLVVDDDAVDVKICIPFVDQGRISSFFSL